MNRLIAVLILVISASAVAAPPPPPPPPPGPAGISDVPPPPPPVQSGQVMQPDVTIIQTENETIYEYRAGANIYMVRIVPRSGPAYYFYDQNGDGQLEYSDNDPRSSNVNQWVLFRW